MLKHVKLYHCHMVQQDPTFNARTHLTLSKDDFDSFETRVLRTMLGTVIFLISIKPKPISTPVIHAVVSIFQKTVKRNQSLFHQYKEERYQDRWHTHTIAQAHAQNVYKVFDLKYKTHTLAEKQLFMMKQKYTFVVFTNKLQTDYSKKLV